MVSSCQPIVPPLLQSQIQKKMTTEMVEPKRKYVDIEAVWKKQRLKKKAGPGGLLSVTIVQARDLRSAHEACVRASVLQQRHTCGMCKFLSSMSGAATAWATPLLVCAGWHSMQQCHACTLLTPCSRAWCLLL